MMAIRPQARQTRRRKQQRVGGENRVFFRLLACLPALCCLLAGPLLAQPDRPAVLQLVQQHLAQERSSGRRVNEPAQNNLLQGEDAQDARTPVSRREASELARERFPGRVLSIRLDNRHWRVRMDQEGTVFNVLVDASSGDVSRSAD